MKKKGMKNHIPDQSELEQYLAGGLPPDRVEEIAATASSDPLLADALEGFGSDPQAIRAIPSFDALHIAMVQEAGVVIAKSIFSSGKFWLFSFLGAGLLGLLIYMGLGKNQPGRMIIRESEIAGLQVVPILSSDTSMHPVAKDRKTQGSHFGEVSLPRDASKLTEEKRIVSRDSINKSGIQSDVQAVNDLKVLAKKADLAGSAGSSKMAVGLIQVEGLKIADYTDFRKKTWSPDGSLSYLQFIQQGLREMKAGHFESSTSVWNQLLNNYPEDANAVYYMGYTQYLAGKYEDAILFLIIAERSAIKAFRPDAEFFHAKCLQKLGRNDEAKQLFGKIAKSNSPRANDANRELYE